MEDNHVIIGWGYKLLKILLIALIVSGIVFTLKLVCDRMPLNLEDHRPQLQRLEEAYRLRQQRLLSFYEEKINSAPNEIISIKYQQEQALELENAQNLYFSDRQAVMRGEYGVLSEHWSAEMKELTARGGGNEPAAE